MTWNTPIAGVSGQVITAAWSTSNVVEQLLHLRLMTGNADPPGSGYLVMAVSPTQTVWGKLTTDYILDGTITDAKLVDAKVSKTVTNYANLALAAAAGTGFSVSFQSGGNVDGPVADDWFVETILSTNRQVQTITSIYDTNLTYTRLVIAGTPTAWQRIWNSGNDGPGSGLDADTLDGTQLAAINQVPSGLIAAFATAAAIPSGWSRYSAADGRILIGAGTTFSQTFTENSNAGSSSWAHGHTMLFESGTNNPAGGSVASGAGSTAIPTHSHTVNGNTNDATWIPPTRVVVWGQKS